MDLNTSTAIERTELAYKRTQLSWVRTVFTLITTGIALDQLVRFMSDTDNSLASFWVSNGHLISTLLTSIGSLLLVAETILYSRRTAKLSEMRNHTPSRLSSTVVLSVFVILIGIFVSLILIIYG